MALHLAAVHHGVVDRWCLRCFNLELHGMNPFNESRTFVVTRLTVPLQEVGRQSNKFGSLLQDRFGIKAGGM